MYAPTCMRASVLGVAPRFGRFYGDGRVGVVTTVRGTDRGRCGGTVRIRPSLIGLSQPRLFVGVLRRRVGGWPFSGGDCRGCPVLPTSCVRPICYLCQSSKEVPAILHECPCKRYAGHGPRHEAFQRGCQEMQTGTTYYSETRQGRLLSSPGAECEDGVWNSLLLRECRGAEFPRFALSYQELCAKLQFRSLSTYVKCARVSSPEREGPILSPEEGDGTHLLLYPSRELFRLYEGSQAFPFDRFPVRLWPAKEYLSRDRSWR